MSDPALKEEARRKLADLDQYFLVPPPIEDIDSSFRADIGQLPRPFDDVAEMFLCNVDAIVETAAIPFTLMSSAVQNRKYILHLAAERIRAGALNLEPGEDQSALEIRREALAREKTERKISKLTEEGVWPESCLIEISSILLDLREKPNIEAVSHELLLQGTVSLWSAFEMLVRDELILLLDSRPDLAPKLLNDPSGRKRFEMPRLSVEDLASRGFNVSGSMGQLLLADKELSPLPTIKAACEALIDSAELREKLGNPTLWNLNQDRHLIAHRRGIVDSEYIRNTGSPLCVGDRISINPSTFLDYAKLVISTGQSLIHGIANIVNESSLSS